VNAFEQPVYASRRTPASLWQEYRVFSDRLELQSWILLHTIVIPAHEILEIEVRPSVFSLRKGFTWGIKLDNSGFAPSRPGQEKIRLLETHRVHAGQSGRVRAHLPIHHLKAAAPDPPEPAVAASRRAPQTFGIDAFGFLPKAATPLLQNPIFDLSALRA